MTREQLDLSPYTGAADFRISLAAYTNAASVLVRFRLTTDPSAQADGWHLDDISVAESPTVVNAPVLDQVTSHTIGIGWAANNEPCYGLSFLLPDLYSSAKSLQMNHPLEGGNLKRVPEHFASP